MKGGGPIGGADSRVRLTLLPKLDTKVIEVSLISRKIILEAREEISRRKEGVCH